ncbi:MAG: hydroxyquinol 1,2-dioxygenase [Rhizobiales bacterium]|nr:hydroxyquinol 1,2-dioxygenase [Hyphomicrobiales bacterium]
MRNIDQISITDAFLGYCGPETDPRLKTILERLVVHLHGFIRETKLTHAEWRRALELLTAAGKITDHERNEFVLFSDVLGVSSLVDMVNSLPGATPASVLGPFHILGAPEIPFGGDFIRDNQGEAVVFSGTVRSVSGEPLAASMEIWQTADNGLYSNQDASQRDYNLRGRLACRDDGRYLFSTIRPAPYTVPDDGPVGELLRSTGRTPWRPSHIHFIISAPGFRTLVTEIFPSDDPYIEVDAVFGVRTALCVNYESSESRQELPAELQIRDTLPTPYSRVEFDFVLAPEPKE